MNHVRLSLEASRARNYTLVLVDSVFVGIVTVAGTFLPVFLVRLGASGTEVGLLTSAPALTAFLLAIPFGRWLQRRRNIVPWYSRLRLVAWLSYGAIGVVVAVVPREFAVPAVLMIWAAASLPSTAGLVAFPIVMDGAAGPQGRFDLLGRRWAISGGAATIGVIVAGQALGHVAFPGNFELLLIVCALGGVGSFLISRQIVIADQPPVKAPDDGTPLRDRVSGFVQQVRGRGTFLEFEVRAFVFTFGIGLATPLLPLFYVHELRAPNEWIGIIGAAQSVGGVAGYLVARRVARRRSGVAVLLPSIVAAAMIPAAMALLNDLPMVAGLSLIGGLAMAAAQLGLFNELMARVPREHGVTFSSVDQTVQNLGLIVAPSVGGVLAATIGVRPGLGMAALVSLAGAGLFVLAWRRGRTVKAAAPGTMNSGA